MNSGKIKGISFLSSYRIYFLFFAIYLFAVILYPPFLSAVNLQSILDNQGYLIVAAIGFSIVMILGQLDLSIGAVLTLGMITFASVANEYGLILGVIAAISSGALIGLLNGILVAKLKVDSFIATLASMIAVDNLNKIITDAELISLDSEFLATQEFLQISYSFLSIKILFILVLVYATHLFMRMTPMGRNIYLIGANEKTAWHSGIATERYLTCGFIASGVFAGLGGVFYALSTGATSFDEGSGSLLTVIASVIVGGISMTGGRGSVAQSFVAIICLASLIKLFNLLGARESVINITSGIVLGIVILYDAILILKEKKKSGQRHELLEEFEKNELLNRGDQKMNQSNNNVTIVCITAIACTAIVSIMAMFFKKQDIAIANPTHEAHPALKHESKESNLTNIHSLKATDGQPLIPQDLTVKAIPDVIEDYQSLPKTAIDHWFDEEYGMQTVTPLPDMPLSPQDGPLGKKVVLLKFVEHPYLTALEKGAQTIANAYGMKLKVLSANNKHSLQAQQVEQVLLEKPDLVIMHPVNANASVGLLKKLYEAKIPVILSNQRTTNEGLKYVLAWSGPDDWANMRKLAHHFVEKMNYKGQYAVVRHFEGNSCYTSRTWGFISEIAKIAPDMECVAMEATKLEKERTRKAVSGWLKQYPDLKGILSGDDSETALGIQEAIQAAGRNDLIVVCAGNSKVGMDLVTEGFISAINYQSAEMDGALPMKLAADWFSGKPIHFINYLPKQIITIENVKDFYPPQW